MNELMSDVYKPQPQTEPRANPQSLVPMSGSNEKQRKRPHSIDTQSKTKKKRKQSNKGTSSNDSSEGTICR